jgi:transcriptional regulator with XRE-family HTH domain
MLTPLRRERILRQLSLYDVRSRTGIAVSKLSLIERQIEKATEDEKRRLARALGVRPEQIFPVDQSRLEMQR